MASPSEFMPWKLTQQEFELRSGFYTTQCLQQLEQSPELANLRKLKKERLAQHARKMKAAMFLFLAFAVTVCAYCGTRNHLQATYYQSQLGTALTVGQQRFTDLSVARYPSDHPASADSDSWPRWREDMTLQSVGLQDFVAQPLWLGSPSQADAALASELPRAEPPPLSSSTSSFGASDSPTDISIDKTPMASPEETPTGGSGDSFQDSLEAEPDVHMETREAEPDIFPTHSDDLSSTSQDWSRGDLNNDTEASCSACSHSQTGVPEHTFKQISGANHTSCDEMLHAAPADFSTTLMKGWSHSEDTQLSVQSPVQSTEPNHLLHSEVFSSRSDDMAERGRSDSQRPTVLAVISCCALAGVILWIIIMTVLEVWAALAPALHRLASLSRRLAAVFRERQVPGVSDLVDGVSVSPFSQRHLHAPSLLPSVTFA